MQYAKADAQTRDMVLAKSNAEWFTMLLQGDMLSFERRPTLTKKQSVELMRKGLRLVTRTYEGKVYAWTTDLPAEDIEHVQEDIDELIADEL